MNTGERKAKLGLSRREKDLGSGNGEHLRGNSKHLKFQGGIVNFKISRGNSKHLRFEGGIVNI